MVDPNEVTATLACKPHPRGVEWSLVRADGGQPKVFGHGAVYGCLPPELRELGERNPPFSVTVLVTISRSKLTAIRIAGASVSVMPEETKAGTPKSTRQEAPVSRPKKRYKLPASSWSRDQGAPAGAFHNPYNFVPAPEGCPEIANANTAFDPGNHPLGHFVPAGHHRYHDDLYSGTLTVTLTVKTPLIVPDTARKMLIGNDHYLLPLLMDGDKPRIPVTSFKGVLRSAYEAITNSRMGIFTGHDDKLGRRLAAKEGLAMIPAQVNTAGNGLLLWMGTATPRNISEWQTRRPTNGSPPSSVMYAAWLPTYIANRSNAAPHGEHLATGPCYPGGSRPQHGDDVVCWLTKMSKGSFSYWRVCDIAKGHDLNSLPGAPTIPPPPRGEHQHVNPPEFRKVRGVVCRTGQNIKRKHDERVFFVPDDLTPFAAPLETDAFAELAEQWAGLISDYRTVADQTRKTRPSSAHDGDYLGQDPGKTAFSRHVYIDDARKLQPGSLCYALVSRTGSITGLYPVMISRDVGDLPPVDFLPANIRPAERLNELSPADRVFGWVSQQGHEKGGRNMHRGQLRIRTLDFSRSPENGPAVTDFRNDPRFAPNDARERANGLPLAILGAPKPQQYRFYLGGNGGGVPLRDADGRCFYSAAARDEGVRLRGRKVYPHHKHSDVADYWSGPKAFADPTRPVADGKDGVYREFARVPSAEGDRRDNQNRSITGWINPGTEFKAVIEVTNLNKAELGALCWLLNLGDDHFLRMGLGKPLGFGSVNLAIASAELRTGRQLRDTYLAPVVTDHDCLDKDALFAPGGPVAHYKSKFAELFEGSAPFDSNPLIAAFRNAARGFDLPVHYPRTEPAPSPQQPSYTWFVDNQSSRGLRQALDPLWAPAGLPYTPTRQDGGDGGRGHGNRGFGQQRSGPGPGGFRGDRRR